MTPLSTEMLMVIARGIGLLLVLSSCVWALVKWRRDTSRDNQRVFEQLDLVREELMQLQQQVISRPTPQLAVPERRTPPEPQRVAAVMTHAAPRGYEVAARLARSGATVSELVSSCGLSRHEAELLLRLHSPASAKAPANAVAATASMPQKTTRQVPGQVAGKSNVPASNWNSSSNANYANATRTNATQVTSNSTARPAASTNKPNHTPAKTSANSVSTSTHKTPAAAKPVYHSRLSLVG